MHTANTNWRVSPAAWVPISLAILAESASNALRAYGLGTHLERFTVNVLDYPVSIAGAILVVAAVAISIAQARAAWVALTPGPLRQRIVSGFAAALLLTVSVTALASHIQEAQRLKVGDESGSRSRFDRTKAELDKTSAELGTLGQVRTVAQVEADMRAPKVDMAVWRRSNGCLDVSREDTRKDCEPFFKLLTERAAAGRKAELETRAETLRLELDKRWRPEEQSGLEALSHSLWAWIMGLAVVFIATFGTVIFARVTIVPETPEGTKADVPDVPTVDDTDKVLDYVQAFQARNGRKPKIPELQAAFEGLPKTTAWRKIKSA